MRATFSAKSCVFSQKVFPSVTVTVVLVVVTLPPVLSMVVVLTESTWLPFTIDSVVPFIAVVVSTFVAYPVICFIDVLLPPKFVALSVTSKTFGSTNVWTGFCSVEEFASPKFQFQDVGEPVEVSVNCTANGTVPFVIFVVKLATGVGVVMVIYPVFRVLLYPPVLNACSATW